MIRSGPGNRCPGAIGEHVEVAPLLLSAPRRRRDARAAVQACALVLGALSLAGCGLNVASADLFLLKRSGAGGSVSLLVNDGGTIRCNGGPARPLSDQQLLNARQLAADLGKDVQSKLRFQRRPGTVYTYTVKVQEGTLTFPDTAAGRHSELARAELFALQALQGPCSGAPR